MAEKKPLPGDLTLECYEDGKVLVRDDKTGAIVTSYQSSDLQRSYIEKRFDKAQDVEVLMGELGLDSQADRSLAQILVKGGSGAISAAQKLFDRAKKTEAQAGPEVVFPFEDDDGVCTIDGRWFWHISPEVNQAALAAIRRRQAQDQEADYLPDVSPPVQAEKAEPPADWDQIGEDGLPEPSE
jgi:hypothetical protein